MQDGDDLSDELHDLEDRFHEHVEIYKENGEQIKQNNEKIQETNEKIDDLINEFKEYRRANSDAIQWLKRVKWGRKAFISLIAALGTVVGFLLGLQELF